MPRFHSLPPEIQDMILQEVSREPSTAPYAVVCKAWQDFFERKNFKSLAINQRDLPCLSRIVTPRRQGFVKQIWYRIFLPNHTTRTLKTFEKPRVLWRADKVFTSSILNLWDILSLWSPQNRITFELSAFSYCDWAHIMRPERIFERDLAEYKVHKKLELRKPYHYDNPHEPYVDQYRLFSSPNIDHRMRTHWNALRHDLLGWKNIEFTTAADEKTVPWYTEEDNILPSVPIISKFLIRRTQFRQFCPWTLSEIFDSLENIEGITIERWASVDAEDETYWNQGAHVAYAMDLPVSVKSLSINGEKCRAFQDWASSDVKWRRGLAKSIRQYSKNLEHMSVTDIIDAKDFLRRFRTSLPEEEFDSLRRWPDLQVLTLSTDLFETQDRDQIENLLCAAARAARKMPKLRTFEIRSSKDAQCLFRYNIVQAIAEITWSGPIVDSTEIMKEWEKTSAWRNNRDVRTNDF
ncbi:uncharacterized protein BKA55DRAFT_540104 [Fusarium redolens]|uniref:DUF6546 domain-containing protein n=1 Tax=Fusarium redolens TaxID=48865 RepID=A0A9P9H1V2_FUSRE|nr:uncharacterized protein BKA55DRAFT_540104 [Fusarium redolens]KAH7248679.1 hypothetical protein BKA55DRAFT_540104 [Fusarium redolens]